MTINEDLFLHGDDYQRTTTVPRKSMCGTCAFKVKGPTVRPINTTVAELEHCAAEYDDFICHTPLADGVHPRCAAWHRLNR